MKINEYFVKIKENLALLHKKNKKLFFVSIVLFVVIGIVFLMPRKEVVDKKNTDTQIIISESSYASSIENKIKSMLSKISVVSSIDVMVVLDSSPINNFLIQKETTKTGETIVEKEEVVYEKNGSSQTPVAISVTYPKIKGVMIVLNKIDGSTKLSIQNAVAGVLNIDTSCIFILQDR